MNRKRTLSSEEEHLAAEVAAMARRGGCSLGERGALLGELKLAGWGVEVDVVLDRRSQKGRTSR